MSEDSKEVNAKFKIGQQVYFDKIDCLVVNHERIFDEWRYDLAGICRASGRYIMDVSEADLIDSIVQDFHSDIAAPQDDIAALKAEVERLTARLAIAERALKGQGLALDHNIPTPPFTVGQVVWCWGGYSEPEFQAVIESIEYYQHKDWYYRLVGKDGLYEDRNMTDSPAKFQEGTIVRWSDSQGVVIGSRWTRSEKQWVYTIQCDAQREYVNESELVAVEVGDE